MQTGNTDYTYKDDLGKACFQHNMACGKFKDLNKRTQSEKVLRDKAFEIASNLKHGGYQWGLASMVYNFFDKESTRSGIKNEIKQNQQFENELHTPIIWRFKKRKVYWSLKYNTWGVDLADMQLISKYNKEIRFLLCVIDLLSRYAWVVPLKDIEGVRITNAFQKVLENSKRKPNKIWIDQGIEFCNFQFKKFFERKCHWN